MIWKIQPCPFGLREEVFATANVHPWGSLLLNQNIESWLVLDVFVIAEKIKTLAAFGVFIVWTSKSVAYLAHRERWGRSKKRENQQHFLIEAQTIVSPGAPAFLLYPSAFILANITNDHAYLRSFEVLAYTDKNAKIHDRIVTCWHQQVDKSLQSIQICIQSPQLC